MTKPDHLPRLQHYRLAAFIVAGLVGLSSAAAAQSSGESDPALQALARRLRSGDTVTVDGPTIGQVRGRLLDLSAESLTVATDDSTRTVAIADIDRVTRRQRGVVLGPLIGLGVGIGFAIPLNMLLNNEGGGRVGPTTSLLAVSTGIGLAIDAAVNLPRTVYRRDATARVQVAPQFGPRGGGPAVRLTF